MFSSESLALLYSRFSIMHVFSVANFDFLNSFFFCSLLSDRPFAVSPVSGVIPVNGSLQVTVDFKPLTVGEHSGEIVLHYDAGQFYYPFFEIISILDLALSVMYHE